MTATSASLAARKRSMDTSPGEGRHTIDAAAPMDLTVSSPLGRQSIVHADRQHRVRSIGRYCVRSPQAELKRMQSQGPSPAAPVVEFEAWPADGAVASGLPDAPPPLRIAALSDDPNLLDALHGA